MRVLIQRVSHARVVVEGSTVGAIERGLLLLVGVTHDDTAAEVSRMASKTVNLRIFDDDAGNLNRSALDLHAQDPTSVGMLVVSQFTLYADARKGRRPSFIRAAGGSVAEPLVTEFARCLAEFSLTVQTGKFGAEMAVELVNDGPVTIWLDSSEV
jgi:D-tyrosyl-tRNA(Tyr) deacylase